MWLLRTALRRPFTVIVAVIGIALCSILALTRMPIDIFPNLNLPVVYVAQPFGGMSPAQMEGYLVYYYEYHFLYITGIESVESKSIQNLALNRVRPLFATLPGVSAPPPFGGSARTIVVSVDPDRLRAYRMAPEEVIQALNTGNAIVPAGNVRTADLLRLAPINTVVSNIKDLQNLPIRTGAGPTVFLRDVGTVEDSSDIVTGYAEVNGRRAVYVLEASKEVQIPRLLAMLCVLAVFVPSFFMVGVSRSLFIPLSLAVG